jgi:HK97 family phage major capsid protein/HK97 family phage prohead protease
MPSKTKLPSELRRTGELTGLVSSKCDDFEAYEFSFSSEYPVDRGWGKEILSHDPTALDTARLDAGVVPLLFNHNEGDLLGRVVSGWIDPRKRQGRCRVVFSEDKEAQRRKSQLDEGILSAVSFKYQIHDWDERDGNFVALRWEPLEISLVTVPADPTVGIGRSIDFQTQKGELEIMPSAVRRQRELIEHENIRVESIRALGNKYQETAGQRSVLLADELIESGTSIELARREFLELVSDCSERNQTPIAYGLDPMIGGHQGRRSMTGSPLGLSRSEAQGYSMCRAILGAAGLLDKDEAGFEFECSRALSKSLNRPTKGILIPIAELTSPQQRGFQVGTPSIGGNLVETSVASANFIDILRNASKCIGLGVTQINDCVGNVAVPRRTGTSTAYWVTEDQAITESTGAFDQVLLQPRQLGALTRFSRLMLQQALPDIETLVRSDFAQILALALDAAIINGSGASGQPRGIMQTAGIQSLALGTNGAAITFERLTEMVRMLRSQNADGDRVAWLLNPNVCKKLQTTLKNPAATDSGFVLPDNQMDPILLGYKTASTNQIPSNLTKGTGTALSAAILANWSDVLLANWGVLEILSNPYGSADFERGSIAVRGMMTVDVGIRQPKAFVVCNDIVTT